MPNDGTGYTKIQRRLAAILAADIAGYSALMGGDEESTVRDLKAHQAVILPMIGQHSGRIIDTAGDGILAEFSSVLAAVKCAISIQRVMAARNATIDAERRMEFRIGINQGDVVFDDARVYGDGVNIAARLESIAPPGGICVSGKVYEEIRRKIDTSFHDAGTHQLKNIAEPVRVYRIGGGRDRNPSTKSVTLDRGRRSGRTAVVIGGAITAALLVVGVIYRFELAGAPSKPQNRADISQDERAAVPPLPAEGNASRLALELPNNTDKRAVEKPSGSVPLTVEQERELSPKSGFKECSACPEMVVVAAGEFVMGSPKTEPGRREFEGPQRKVSFHANFAAARYAVTREEFKAFVDATIYRYGDSCLSQAAAGWANRANTSFLSPPGFSQDERHPVVCVSWKDANAYAVWLSAQTQRPYRLLTEAEREYIARAGTSTPYWWGTTIKADQANFDTAPRPTSTPGTTAPGWQQRVKSGTSRERSATPLIMEPGVASGRTMPVDQGLANPWGFFHVHGNVAEWVQDCWKPDYAGASGDGYAEQGGTCPQRVLRGGSWSYWPEDIRAAYREMGNQDERYNSVGFRVARDLRR